MSTPEPVVVLVVDDEPAHTEAIRRSLLAADPAVEIVVAGSIQGFHDQVAARTPSIVLLDWKLPDGYAIGVLTCPSHIESFPILIMTSHGNEQTAVEAMRAGALDYVVKSPEAFAEMPRTVVRALREWALRGERDQARSGLRHSEVQRLRLTKLLQDTEAIAKMGGWEFAVASKTLIWTDEVYRIYGVGRDFDPNDIARAVAAYTPESSPVIERAFRRAVEFGESYDLELQFIRATGETIWVRTIGKVETIDGRVVRVFGNIVDITDRKVAEAQRERVEMQLQQLQKMEAMGRLAGGVAHDFNNMLSVILSYAESALAELKPGNQMYEDLVEIQSAGLRSAELTRHLLAFSRRGVVRPQIISLNRVIEGQKKMLQRLIGEDILLSFLPCASIPSIRFDPSQIDQILVNLAANARDAIGGIGTVTIRTDCVHLETELMGDHLSVPVGSYVVLQVTDSGVGMGPDTLAHVFEPFFTTKDVGKGTGLGLATVYGIVRQNGGHIQIDSTVGMGTTFKLFLPPIEGEVAVVAPVATEAPQGGSETVLVVDDNAQLLQVCSSVLSRHGYHVISASTPSEACQRAAAHDGAIHLLLTDVVMPEMNGRELQSAIAALRPHIRTLFMSGYSAEILVNRGGGTPQIDLVEKPFSARSLCDAVRRALDAPLPVPST